MSERVVVRCQGRKKNGQQCSRRTGKSQLCYQHLEMQEHLKIRPSHIPGAGMGLYTTIERDRGENITEYGGRHVHHDPHHPHSGPYAVALTRSETIDATRTNSTGRWANACRGRDRDAGHCPGQNAHLVPNYRAREVNVRATRHINAGQEVFVSYGAGYWRGH